MHDACLWQALGAAVQVINSLQWLHFAQKYLLSSKHFCAVSAALWPDCHATGLPVPSACQLAIWDLIQTPSIHLHPSRNDQLQLRSATLLLSSMSGVQCQSTTQCLPNQSRKERWDPRYYPSQDTMVLILQSIKHLTSVSLHLMDSSAEADFQLELALSCAAQMRHAS